MCLTLLFPEISGNLPGNGFHVPPKFIFNAYSLRAVVTKVNFTYLISYE